MLVRHDVVVDLTVDREQTDLDAILDVLHTVQRKRQGLQQVDGIQMRNELQSFAGLREVYAAVNCQQHEGIGVLNILHVHFHLREELVEGIMFESVRRKFMFELGQGVEHEVDALHERGEGLR